MFAVFGLGPQEIALLAVAGVLLFGRKLPEFASYLGKSVVSFRNSIKGLEDGIEGTPAVVPPLPAVPPRGAASAPKFQDNV